MTNTAKSIAARNCDYIERAHPDLAPVLDIIRERLEIMESWLVRLHVGGMLSEGQASKATGLHRIALREKADAHTNNTGD